MSLLTNFLSDLGAEIGGEVVGVKMLKSIITKAIAHKATAGGVAKAVTGTTPAQQGAQSASDVKTPEVKLGGLFDYSDEEGYLGLMARIKPAQAQIISAFLDQHLTANQRGKFRSVVANLGRIDYTKRVTKTRKPKAGTPAGATPTEDKTTETKTNLGIEFLRGFGAYTDDQKKEICQAAGIMDSVIDNVSESLTHLGKHIAKTAEAIEQSPTAQTVMKGLTDLMQERIDHLNSKP